MKFGVAPDGAAEIDLDLPGALVDPTGAFLAIVVGADRAGVNAGLRIRRVIAVGEMDQNLAAGELDVSVAEGYAR